MQNLSVTDADRFYFITAEELQIMETPLGWTCCSVSARERTWNQMWLFIVALSYNLCTAGHSFVRFVRFVFRNTSISLVNTTAMAECPIPTNSDEMYLPTGGKNKPNKEQTLQSSNNSWQTDIELTNAIQQHPLGFRTFFLHCFYSSTGPKATYTAIRCPSYAAHTPPFSHADFTECRAAKIRDMRKCQILSSDSLM